MSDPALPNSPRFSRLAIASSVATPAAALAGVIVYYAVDGPGRVGWDALAALIPALLVAAAIVLVGFVLGIVAWVRIAKRNDLRGRPFAIVGALLPALLVLAMAIMGNS